LVATFLFQGISTAAMASCIGEAFGTSDEDAGPKVPPPVAKKRLRTGPAALITSGTPANAGLGSFATSDEEEVPRGQKRPCPEARADSEADVKAAETRPAMKRPAASSVSARSSDEAMKRPAAAMKRPAAYRPDPPVISAPSALPLNSGAFAYARWVADTQLSDEEKLGMSHLGDLVVGSLCTGMCTEALAFEALRRAMPETFPKVTIAFVCESNNAKQGLLSRLLPDSILVGDVSDLADDPVSDTSGKQWDRPRCDWLIGGLSCKCLSKLNNSPQSVMGDGPTGITVKGTLTYLDSMSFEERPDVVTVEEVGELLHKRTCEDDRAAIQILADQMDARGYTAKWQELGSMMFYLPHSRDRVWINFRKRKDLSTDMVMLETVASMLMRSSAVIAKLQTGGQYESLAAILDKLGEAAFRVAPPLISPAPISEPTAAKNTSFMEKHSLAVADIDRMASLDVLLSDVLTPRARKAVGLKLAQMAKQKGWRWDHDLLVATAGQSASFMTMRKDVFPNLVPSAPFVVLRAGKPRLASGLLCLAMQGLQSCEVEFMNLGSMPEEKQRDIAGNAFTANVCIANLVGVMLELLPKKC
jgi:site-specific DNA-cytosine methylase